MDKLKTHDEIVANTQNNIASTYGRNNLAIVEGSGCLCKTANGETMLDFTSGIGVNCLGFCDADWANAICQQAKTLQHTSNLYYTEPSATLAKKLCEKTSMECVFFANSGAEANEGAIKAARKYSFEKYGEGRHTILSLQNSFHGRTLATLTATGQDVFHQYFNPFPQGFEYVEANDYEAFVKAAQNSVCAILLEIVQGEGGVIPLEKEYVSKIYNWCNENDVLIIVDEVQTGIGRTGTLLACEQYGIKPDIVTLAKGLGGGLPIGAVLFGEKAKNSLRAGDHGSTYGANPVVCAGANVVLDKLNDEFLQNVKDNAAYLKQKLENLPHVKSVDGLGLMIGIAFDDSINAKEVLDKCMAKGLMCLTAKTKLRLLPPLIVTKQEIDLAVSIMESVLSE